VKVPPLPPSETVTVVLPAESSTDAIVTVKLVEARVDVPEEGPITIYPVLEAKGISLLAIFEYPETFGCTPSVVSVAGLSHPSVTIYLTAVSVGLLL